MKRNLIIITFLGCITILLGAFGAHTLQNILSVSELKSFETGVRYQMYHVIVLLFVNTFAGFKPKSKNIISYFFFMGILFFSGSIYAITLGVNAKSIWFVTPLGGLFFMLGWLKMMLCFYKKDERY